MKNFKNTFLPVAFAVLSSTSAFAQTSNFEGASVYLGLSTVSTNAKIEQSGASINGFGKSSYATDIGADYGLKISDAAVVLLGGAFGLNKTSVYENSGTGGGFDGSLDLKNRWSLYAAPGTTIGKDVLLFAKIAFSSAKADTDGGKTHSGFGFGAGTRVILSNQMFLNVEFMNNSYGKKDYSGIDVSANSTVGTVALGYKF